MDDDTLKAYLTGRLDGVAGHRDPTRTTDPVTGNDYRMGFLDGRIEVFHMFVTVRKMLEEAD